MVVVSDASPKELALINQVGPVLEQLREEAGFWIGQSFMITVLREVGEWP